MVFMQESNMKTVDFENDEIDLFELWNGLVEEKKVILGVLFSVVLIAALYAFLAKPWYQSKAYLLPPTNDAIQELNSLSLLTDKDFYKTEQVFQGFSQDLVSKEILSRVFKEYDIVGVYDDSIQKYKGIEYIARYNLAFEEFSKDIKLNLPKKNSDSNSVSIELLLPYEPEKVAEILNYVINLAQQKTINDFVEEVNAEAAIRKQRLVNQIANLRKIEKDRRLDRIVILEEAVKIARSLDMSEPMKSGPEVNIEGVGMANQGMPLYYLGYRLLEAELNALRERKNDDPFIPELRKTQQALADLETISINPKNISVVTVDQMALPASKPAKPKKALILAVAIVFGGLLGIFIALIRRAYKKRINK